MQEKNMILEYLSTSDIELDTNPAMMSLAELIDVLIEKIEESELDYSILSNAFVNRVNPGRFEDFHDAVMNQYEATGDGQEIPEPILDRIASQYR